MSEREVALKQKEIQRRLHAQRGIAHGERR